MHAHACPLSLSSVWYLSLFRGYSAEKVNENVEAEIFQVCLDEAMESYPKEKIIVMSSNTVEQLEANVAKLEQWVRERTA
jgi:adenylate kinase